jgi:hypothetical protein
MLNQQHRDFLFELGTLYVWHSGRSLYLHLKGTHDLLRDWDNSEDVCLAGLFHSIYGTNSFKRQSLDDRRKLRELIGDYAEQLVYNFSVAKDRPLFESIANERMRGELQEIEAANIVEQSGSAKTLVKLLRPKNKLSGGARAALQMELAG